MTPDICIYHGNCADGFGAAFVLWGRFGDGVQFVPGIYGEAPPDVTGKDVVLVDFSYKRPVLDKMASAARTLVILDHHKTAAADLAGLPPPPDGPYNPDGLSSWQHECNAPVALHALFDMDRSGAQIAWDYFYPGQRRPKLIDYIGDRDLWRFKLPHSREIAAWVFSYPYTFPTWDEMARQIDSADYFQGCVDQGAAIERKHNKDIAELLTVTRRKMKIGGHVVPVANLPYTMSSDAAHKLCEPFDDGLNGSCIPPFAACYFDRPDARVFSLRSRDDGADVSEIARTYGGGGHKHAAGFQASPGWEGDA